jgi:hypothetical protein
MADPITRSSPLRPRFFGLFSHSKRPFEAKFSPCINSCIAAIRLVDLKKSQFDENHAFSIDIIPFDVKNQ